MKTINILGKRMSVMAILMAALIVGTASAAVYSHYATLEGTVDIGSPITVTVFDELGAPITIGYGDVMYTELLIEDIMAPGDVEVDLFINNVHPDDLEVVIRTTIYETGMLIEDAAVDESGMHFYYTYATGTDEESLMATGNNGVTPYTSSIEIPSYVVGSHTVRIEVMPYSAVPQ